MIFIGFVLALYTELGLGRQMIIGTIDVLIIVYTCWNAIRMGFFCVAIIHLFRYYCSQHLNEMNRHLIVWLQLTNKSKRFPAHLKQHLAFFQREHHRLRSMAEHVNRKVASNLMFVTFFTNIAVNVVLLNILLMEQLQFAEQALILFFISSETILGMSGTEILISWADVLYKYDGLLYRAQGAIQRTANGFALPGIIAYKLRLQGFFELICTTRKFHFTLGPIAQITKRSLYEVCIVLTI